MTLRPPKWRFVIALLCFQVGLMTVNLTTHDDDDPGWLRGMWWALLVLVLVGLGDTLWRRLVADQHGVRARTAFFRRRSIPWQRIHHFEDRGLRRGFGVWTVDGRWIGLAQTGSSDPRTVDERAALERYRVQQQHALGLF